MPTRIVLLSVADPVLVEEGTAEVSIGFASRIHRSSHSHAPGAKPYI